MGSDLESVLETMAHKSKPTVREYAVAVALGIPLGICASLVRAWCIVKAWAWALLPLGAPRIDIAAVMIVMGAVAVARVLANREDNQESRIGGRDPVKAVVMGSARRVVGWLVFLGFAWAYARALR